MLYEFYPVPGTKVPVTINGNPRGYLTKLVFQIDCEYPFNHRILKPDLINAPVIITTRRGADHLIEPERLARYQSESFKLVSVHFTKEQFEKEVYYRWKKIPKEERVEDFLDLSNKL